jgi:hypothetical protein
MPQFVSPGAMAGNAIQKFLMQREEEEQQRVLAQLIRQKQEQDAALALRDRASKENAEKRRIGLEDEDRRIAAEDRTRTIGRQDAQDAVAAGTRRQAQNTVGVRQKMAAGLQSGADPRQVQLQAFGEGVDIPQDVLDPGAEGRAATAKDERDFEQAKELARLQGDLSLRTVTANQGGRGAGGTASGSYADRTSSRLTSELDRLEGMVGPNTVGTWRAKGMRAEPFAPGSVDPTVDFDAAVGQIKALIGFNELNAMRQASPTGGALGNITEKELAYLQSVMGSLDPNQSEPVFRAQIAKIRGEIDRVVNQGLGATTTGRASGAGPAQGGGRVYYDINGKPVQR